MARISDRLSYLILGQHFISEEGVGRTPNPSPEKERVTTYFDNIITAMNTGRITYVAHPDLINYSGDDTDFYIAEAERFISESIRLGMPLEYNLLGMAERRSYPNELFWRRAAQLGATAVLGCDAHSPCRVGNKKEIEKALSFLRGLKIPVADKLGIRDPGLK